MNGYRIARGVLWGIGFSIKAVVFLLCAGIAVLIAVNAWQTASWRGTFIGLAVMAIVGAAMAALFGTVRLYEWLGRKAEEHARKSHGKDAAR